MTNSPSRHRVVLVVPAYNEAARFPKRDFIDFLKGGGDVGFVFVDDGSTDGTVQLIEAVRAEHPDRVSLLTLDKNSGKAEAVRRGVVEALQQSPDIVGYWDADLATPLSALSPMVSLLDGDVDLVLGSRVQLLGRTIVRRAVRHYLGRVYATVASIQLGLAVYDTQCGAKVFRVDSALADCFDEEFIARWAFDVEIIARYLVAGERRGVEPEGRIVELPLTTWIDVPGSKVGMFGAWRAFFDLFRIGRRLRRDRRRLAG